MYKLHGRLLVGYWQPHFFFYLSSAGLNWRPHFWFCFVVCWLDCRLLFSWQTLFWPFMSLALLMLHRMWLHVWFCVWLSDACFRRMKTKESHISEKDSKEYSCVMFRKIIRKSCSLSWRYVYSCTVTKICPYVWMCWKSVENNNCFYSFVHNLQKTSYSSNVVHAQYFLYWQSLCVNKFIYNNWGFFIFLSRCLKYRFLNDKHQNDWLFTSIKTN